MRLRLSLLAWVLLAAPSLSRAAAAIESGFPVVTTSSYVNRSSIGASVTTAGASVLVAVLDGRAEAAAFPATIAGGGVSWSSVEDRTQLAGSYANRHTAQAWMACSSGAISAQTVTATFSGSATNFSGLFAVYSITGASCTVGAHTGSADTTGSNVVQDVAVVAQASGSIILVAVGGDDNTALTGTVLANSTIDSHVEELTLYTNPAIFHLTGTTTGAGSVTVGSTYEEPYISKLGIEILSASTQAATPTAAPAAGVYSTAQDVTLSCTSPSPTIRYTTDGSTPTGSSTVYSSAIHVDFGTSTIKAICQSSGLDDSAVGSFTYYVYPVQYIGSSALSAGTSTVTCAMPTGGAAPAAGDILLLAVSSENEAISLSTANGFAEVPTCSPQYAGTAATDPGSRLALFWKRAVGSDTAPVAADSGNNTECAIHVFRGAVSTGNPWDVCAGGNDSAANDTTGNVPGATTTVANTTVVLFTSTSYNATVSDDSECSGWTNSGLDSLTGRYARTNTAGLGGGHCMAVGFRGAVGDYGTTSVTLAHTSYKGAISIALKGPVEDGGKTSSPAAVASQSASLALSMGLASSPASTTSMSTTVSGAMGLAAAPASVASMTPTATWAYGLTGALDSTVSTSGTVGLAMGITGSVAGGSSLVGTLAGNSPESVAPAAVASFAATLTLDAGPTPLELASSPAGQAASTGNLALALGLTSSPAAQASVAPTQTLSLQLSASPAAQASMSATYASTFQLSSHPAATGSLTDAGCTTSLGIACSPAAQASAGGTVAWGWRLNASPTAQGAMSVNATVAQLPEVASATAQAAASGVLTFAFSGSGSAIAQASASATITTEGTSAFLGSAPAAQASTSATLLETFGMQSRPAAVAGLSASLGFGQPETANPSGQAGFIAGLSLALPISASMDGDANIDTANVDLSLGLSGRANAGASAGANTSTAWSLSASMGGQASVASGVNGWILSADMAAGADLDATVGWGWTIRGDIGGSSSMSAGLTLTLGTLGASPAAQAAVIGRLTLAGQVVLIPALQLKMRLDSPYDRPFLWRMVSGDAETARLAVLSSGATQDCSSCTARLRVYRGSTTIIDRTSTVAPGGLLDITILPGDAQPAGQYYASLTVDDDSWPGSRIWQGTLDLRAAPTLPAAPAPLTPAAVAAKTLTLNADHDLDVPFSWTLPAGSAQTARLVLSVGGQPQTVAGMTATCGTSSWAEQGVAEAGSGAFRVTLRPTDTPARGAWGMACRLTAPSWPGPRTVLGTLQAR